MLEVPLRVRVDHIGRDDRALGRPARGVADPRRVVADDQDSEVPLVLERSHPLERNSVPERDIGGGDVDPQLHPERPAQREFVRELPFGQHIGGVAGQLDEAHGSESKAGRS